MCMRIKELITNLGRNEKLEREEFRWILTEIKEQEIEWIKKRARNIADEVYGKNIYLRGLIECSNYCKNDCYYCGIRCSNKSVNRYRLNRKEILECCKEGYELGFRTFVIQGGEDPYYTDNRLVEIIANIKSNFPECAITLSLGERDRESYRRLKEAGADRYLLRHETANPEHYAKLHPDKMSWKYRRQCLYWLKELGYQVGCGFMVGTPYQTVDDLVEELFFLKEIEPQMIGIGPFLSHRETPFRKEKNGSLTMTLLLLSLIRIMHKRVLLPATTALATLDANGRELGILAGANVLMPNLSPVSQREKYTLYDGKVCMGDEAAECRMCLEKRLENIGYHSVVDRGDSK
ncbi:MAG: [FeFe] hydrogenase H-cluster radical SAM maturase HydE [Clostridiales bacterium]|nr:[FeFe] hydrogenase H-cluster radical SAM maturase HydE [Clostridiales bacterium]